MARRRSPISRKNFSNRLVAGTLSASQTIASATLIAITLALCAPYAPAQNPSDSRQTAASSPVERGLQLADTGHCQEALPILRRALPRITDHDTKYAAAIAVAQCDMSLHQVASVLEDLGRLNRDFPNDPQVLYITTHFCSEMAQNASQELAHKDPTSYQAQELDAEAYEAHGKWDDALTEYKRILQQYAKLRGIHYRMGRVILSMPSTPTTAEDAKQQFEEELKIDPSNAAAEFMLGDLDRQLQQWPDAIEHFQRAAQLDVGFVEADLGLGMALNAEGRYADAIAPLETYVKGVPDDPAGHYQLGMAYARTGRREEAQRELERQRELNARVNGTTQPVPANKPQ